MISEYPRHLMIAAIGIAAFAPLSAIYAQDDQAPRPAAVQELVECRTIADNQQRLACYDEKVANFEAAENSGDLLVADKEVVKKAREDIFGLSVSDNPIFTGKKGETLDGVTSVVKSVRQLRGGKWVMTLENGSVWQQTEARITRRGPREGEEIILSRGALGSFKAEVGGRRAFKVIRIR